MIRNATLADFEFVYQLYMHPKTNPFLLYEYASKEEFLPIIQPLIESSQIYIFYDAVQDLGMFKLIPLAHRNIHIAYLGGVAIHPEIFGKGLGKKMLEEIVAFGNEKGFLRIELSVATHNEKAIYIYEKVGFCKEGTLRKYSHLKSEGRFIDEFMMAYLY